MDDIVNDHEVRSFLLGNADDAVTERVGVRIVADADFAEVVAFVEESLIEEYLDGELNDSEAELFRDNFMSSPYRIRLLEEISAIRLAAAALDEPQVPVAPTIKSRSRLFPVWAFALVFIVVCAGGIFLWRSQVDISPSPLEVEFAALNSGDVQAEAAKRGIRPTVLEAGSLRGAGGNTRASAGAEIFLNLALPDGANETAYDLEIKRGTTIVFRQRALSAIRSQSGGEIRALVPPLEKGNYRIFVGDNITYELVVE